MFAVFLVCLAMLVVVTGLLTRAALVLVLTLVFVFFLRGGGGRVFLVMLMLARALSVFPHLW